MMLLTSAANAAVFLVMIAVPPGATSPPSAAPAIEAASLSIFDLVVKGGIVMIPLGLCSLVMLAIIVERALQLRRSQLIPEAFLPGLRAALGDGRADRREPSLAYCRQHDGPIGRIFAVAIKRLGEPEESLERHIQEAGEREVPLLRRRLRVLAIIGSVATLLGLLGTILGMIRAFQTVAASAEALGKTELLARGIYEAMVTTAAGLIVAIPAVISYHWLSARVEMIVSELDRITVEFIEEFGRPGSTAAPTPAPTAAAPHPSSNGAFAPPLTAPSPA
jgi:biopolymer transport protein ExbB